MTGDQQLLRLLMQESKGCRVLPTQPSVPMKGSLFNNNTTTSTQFRCVAYNCLTKAKIAGCRLPFCTQRGLLMSTLVLYCPWSTPDSPSSRTFVTSEEASHTNQEYKQCDQPNKLSMLLTREREYPNGLQIQKYKGYTFVRLNQKKKNNKMKYQIKSNFHIYSRSRGRDTSPPKEDENMIFFFF